MSILDDGGLVSEFLINLTTNVTGSYMLTFLLLIVLLFALCMAFNMPLEFSAIIVLPLVLVFVTVTSSIYVLLGAIIFYLGAIFAKNMFF